MRFGLQGAFKVADWCLDVWNRYDFNIHEEVAGAVDPRDEERDIPPAGFSLWVEKVSSLVTTASCHTAFAV